MSSVDTRIVRMEFDNDQFENGVKNTMNTLEKLEDSLKMENATSGLDSIQEALNNINLNALGSAIDSVNDGFSALGIAGKRIIEDLTDTVYNFAKNTLSSLWSTTIGQIKSGGIRRAQNIAQAKFQLKGLGIAWEDVSEAINYAVDGTAYGLDAAARAASQLAASGVGLGEDMKTALRGISGVAAMTNSEYEDISRVFTQVAGQGKLLTRQLQMISLRGINAAATLADYLGVSETEVREMTTQGEIDFATFAAAMDSAFGEHAKDANETFTGVMSNIRAALSRIGADIATPTMDKMIPFLQDVRTMINKIHDKLKPVIEDVNNFIAKVVDWADKKVKAFTEALEGDSFLGGFVDKIKGVKDNAEEAKKKLEEFRDIVDSVIRGDFGNGSDRFKKLTDEGYNYLEVQDLVNYALLGTTSSLADLSDEQLANLGYTDDEIAKIRELATTLEKNLALSAIGHVKNAFENLKTIFAGFFDAVVESIENNPTTSGFIDNVLSFVEKVTGDIEHFTEKIANGDFSNITSILNGAIAVFEELATIAGGAFTLLSPIVDVFIDLGGAILDAAGKLGDWLTSAWVLETVGNLNKKAYAGLNSIISKLGEHLRNAKSKLDGFLDSIKQTKFVQDLSAKLEELRKNVKTFIDAFINDSKEAKKAFNGFFGKDENGEKINYIDEDQIPVGRKFIDMIDSIKQSLDPLTTSFGNAAKEVRAFFDSFKKKDDEKNVEEKKNGFDKLIAVLDMFYGALTFIGGKIVEGFNWIMQQLGKTLNTDGSFLENMYGLFGKIFTVEMLSNMVSFFASLTRTMEDASGFIKNLKSIGSSITGVFSAMTKKIKAGTLQQIAFSIVMLVGAVTVLSMLDPQKLDKAISSLVMLFVELLGAFKVFSMMSGTLGNVKLSALGSTLIKIAAAVLILSFAVKKLAALSWEELAKGLVGVGVLMVELAASVRLISGNEKGIIKASAGLILFGAAIRVLSKAVLRLADLSWEQLAKGLIGVGALCLELALFMNGTDLSKMGLLKGAGLILLAASLKVLAKVVQKLGSMSIEELSKGLIGLGVALAELSLFLNFTSGKMGILKGTGLILFATSLKILASAVKQFGNLSVEQLMKGLIGLGVALAAVTVAINAMPATLPLIGAGLILVSVALAAITAVVAAAGHMSWETIGKGLLTLAGAMAVLGVAAAVLGPLVPAMLGVSAAVALLGVGVLAAGAGLLALSAGITALGVSLAAGTGGIVAAIDVIVMTILDLIPAIATGIANGITRIIVTIGDNIPQIIEAVRKVVDAVLKFIGDEAPNIVDTVFTVVISIFEKLRDDIGPITELVGDIIVNFLEAFGKKVPEIVDGLFKCAIEIVNGLAEALRGNTDDLFAALRNMLSALIELVLSALDQLLSGIPVVGDSIHEALEGAKKKVREVIAPESFKTMGEEAGAAVSEGFNEQVDSVSEHTDSTHASLKEKWESVTSWFAEKWAAIKEGAKSLFGAGEQSGQSYIEGLNGQEIPIKECGIGIIGLVRTGISTVIGLFKGDGETSAGNFQSGIDGQENSLIEKGKSILGWLRSGIGTIASKLFGDGETVVNNMTNGVDNKETTLFDKGKSILGWIRGGIGSIASMLFGDGERVGDEFTSGVDSKDEEANSSGAGLTSNVVSGIGDITTIFTDIGSQIGNAIISGIGSLGEAFFNAGANIVAGLKNGISNGAGFVINGVKTLGSNISNAFTSVMQMNSPSKLFEGFGEYIDLGLAKGIEGESGSVMDSLDYMTTPFQTAMQTIQDIMDSDIDLSPTITPVLDLSSVRSGAGSIGSYFGSQSMQLAGINATLSAENARYWEKANASKVYNDRNVVAAISGLKSDFVNLQSAISGMGLYLDGKTLVGGITPQLDRSLGQRTTLRTRGVR